MLFHQRRREVGPLRQQDRQLGHFVGDLLQVVAQAFREQLGDGRIDDQPPFLGMARNPLRQLVVPHLLAQKQRAVSRHGFHRLEPGVRFLVRVGKDEHGRGHGVCGVGLQFGHLVLALPHPHVLGLFHQHELAIRHHRKPTCRRKHLVHVRVPSVQNRLVEILHGWVDHVLEQRVHDFRNEEWLLPVQDVDGRALSRLDVPDDLAVRHDAKVGFERSFVA